jgi:hypothetical protein
VDRDDEMDRVSRKFTRENTAMITAKIQPTAAAWPRRSCQSPNPSS